jgi:tRNA dimethylallyltransferase
MSKKSKIIVILGPTSSGKSDMAIRLAKKFNGEIISADSRQIYRGMDIGTGKITKKEQGAAKHWMLDIVNPRTKFSVAQFKKKVDKIIPNILKRGKTPIICGGTGFWIKSVIDNVAYPEVKPNWKLRAKLHKKSTKELFKMLKNLDKQRAKDIDPNNKVRLVRAIEICRKLGSVPDIKHETLNTNYAFLQIGIKISKKKLHANIKKRLEKRFRTGMIKEVEKMRKLGLSWEKIQSFGLGYFWIPLYLQNKISKEELFKKVFQAEKNYAKRQMAWFRKDKRIKWLEKYREIEKVTGLYIK